MATDPGRCPRLIAVSGAKGGVGKTTLATNLGVVLAGKNVGSVVVWDAYSQFGDVGDIMAISSARPLAEIAELNQDLDEDIMLNCMVHHYSRPLGALGERLSDSRHDLLVCGRDHHPQLPAYSFIHSI